MSNATSNPVLDVVTASSACAINELVVRAPTGEPLTVPMAEWFQFRGSLIVEHRVFYDPREFGRVFGLC
jgi:hypothetical protein